MAEDSLPAASDPEPTPLEQATRLIETERAQIGHEIHDGLLPLIFAASAAVSNLLDQPEGQLEGQLEGQSSERLRLVAGLLDDAMQTGRRLLTQVYPPELEGTLWTNAARDMLGQLLRDSEMEIRWQIDQAVNDVAAPLALTAYRIVVEAVRNASRHGKASEVLVEANRSPAGLQITIRDDGVGFDRSQVPEDRFGIRAMTQRAKLVGGSLELNSVPGGPTTVDFVVPHESVL